ncbi:unnamed protein product [Diatraea saccharalis]|uniref:Uncharacterized protein n=1 Tax=Diatraea saccharalis TaxID=40085 RepID=A0A9N9WKZ3_9NEOP|nr:unnamed protein product [Diatraea saccharalis]
MTLLAKIYLLITVIELYHVANSTPIFEAINIEKKINLQFKPFKFRPITFITEKWGPFGKFMGRKHIIERRDLETNVIDKYEDAATRVKNPNERMIPVEENVEDSPNLAPPFRLPIKVIMPPSSPIPAADVNTNSVPNTVMSPSNLPPARGLNTNILSSVVTSPRNPSSATSLNTNFNPVAVMTPTNPPPAAGSNTNNHPKVVMPPPPPGLNTNIISSIPGSPFFTPLNPYMRPVVNPPPIVEVNPIGGPLIVPKKPPPTSPVPPVSPVPPPKEPNNGSRPMGIFGFIRDLFSELMIQLITRARSSMSQLGNPPVQQ